MPKSVKIVLNDDVRRVPVPEENAFQVIRKYVTDTLRVEHFVLRYLDDENELCTVSSEAELEEAFRLAQLSNSKILKLVVSPKDQPQPHVDVKLPLPKKEDAKSAPAPAPAPADDVKKQPPQSDKKPIDVQALAMRLLSDPAKRAALFAAASLLVSRAADEKTPPEQLVEAVLKESAPELRDDPEVQQLAVFATMWLKEHPDCISKLRNMLTQAQSGMHSLLPLLFASAAQFPFGHHGPRHHHGHHGHHEPRHPHHGPPHHAPHHPFGPPPHFGQSPMAGLFRGLFGCHNKGRRFDPTTGQPMHRNVSCDQCTASPITGPRFKCRTCPNFDLCGKCHANSQHPADHRFTEVPFPLRRLRLDFLEDVTIPDGAVVTPGAVLRKVWRFRNQGHDLPAGVEVVFEDGTVLPISNAIISLPEIKSGASFDVVVEVKVPKTPGTHKGHFQLVAPDGRPFRMPFWIEVQVPKEEEKISPPLSVSPQKPATAPPASPDVAPVPSPTEQKTPTADDFTIVPPAETQFAIQLAQLADMGFFDKARNLQLLSLHNGNIEAVLHALFS